MFTVERQRSVWSRRRKLPFFAPAAGGFGEATPNRGLTACQRLARAFGRLAPVLFRFRFFLHPIRTDSVIERSGIQRYDADDSSRTGIAPITTTLAFHIGFGSNQC
ncbi:MAG TPA: hypothetical protein VE396_05770 [Xanthobacteraceae bacterium]|nr:hypothetical protein [Xanthobacteraceae bacterium]